MNGGNKMTRDQVAAKYGIANDAEGELSYAVAWEADNSIGYPPINHNGRPLTAKQIRLQQELNSEGWNSDGTRSKC